MMRNAMLGRRCWRLLGALALLSACAPTPEVTKAHRMLLEPAVSAEQRGDYQTAFDVYRSAAEHGVVLAQYNLARMYQAGRGVEQSDAEAARWFYAAASTGYPRAFKPMAKAFEAGKGVPKDEAKALELYRQAAAGGNPTVEYDVGRFIEEGRSVPADPAAALPHYKIAAEAGVADAQLALARLYRTGTGVAEDPAEADRWATTAPSPCKKPRAAAMPGRSSSSASSTSRAKACPRTRARGSPGYRPPPIRAASGRSRSSAGCTRMAATAYFPTRSAP
jgi:hypothetical protein